MAGKIIAIEHLTLDGVFQAPARADEDTRGGFKHGGWSAAGNDPKMQESISKYMAGGWSLLIGRTTYEDFFESWPTRQPEDPMTKALTDVQKFVATRQTEYKLPWENSTLLTGNIVKTVAKLKQEHDKTLIIFGSAELVRSLMQQNLVDEFLLMIHPIVLGKGRRLFDSAAPFTALNLAEQAITGTGVIISAYQIQIDAAR